MTHRKLLKEESKVKALLLKGMSKSAVASKTGYSRSKVDKIVGRLTHYGEIRAIPGTKNPIIYEDPRSVIVTANPDVYNKIFALRYLERECKTIWKGKRIYIIPDALLHREKFSLSPTNEAVLSLPENAKLLY